MTPEAKARQLIDQKLEQAGWVIQDMKQLNLGAGIGVAVREYPTDTGPADYVLFVQRNAAGVIEAKKDAAGENLTVTESQTERYADAHLKWRKDNTPLRFLFEATGQIIRFTDGGDPAPRSREIFHFFKPETVAAWWGQPDTLRRRLAEHLPALPERDLRECQVSAVIGLEKSLALNKPRALVHMATGAGKTFTAITSVYRLLKFGGAKRVLFLVDTRNLGKQAHQEFMAYTPPDDGRKFTELYNVQRLASPSIDPHSQVDDTPVHEALREALANTLIHADYSERVSVLVVKRPDMFGFRNPGRMRIPPVLAIQGGNSDCRNRRLQTMFQLVGYGDHAGSGLPKIYKNWAGQHWRSPLLYELSEPEQTLMEMRMSSLVPAPAIEELTSRLGARFAALPETARLALITAQVEGVVSHDRLKQITTDHPADLTKLLGTLVRDGVLLSEGAGRGMVYFLPWRRYRAAAAFDLPEIDAHKPPELAGKPPELAGKPPELGGEPPVLALFLDWNAIPPALQAQLLDLASPVAQTGWVRTSVLRGCISALCMGRFLGLRVLAHALQRDPDDLRKRTLMPLVKAGVLRTAFPAARDPRQAYTASAVDTNQP